MSSILDGLDWEPVARAQSHDGLPIVTHEGILEIGAHKLRCYRLDDGRAIINADDFRAFFGGIGIEPASALPVVAASTKPANGEVRGASRLAGEASASTVVLGATSNGERN